MKFTCGPLMHYFALTALFLFLVMLLPASQTAVPAYDIAALQHKALVLLYVLPLAVIWFTAFYGYSLLRTYVSKLHTAPERAGFAWLVHGSGWLAYGLPITAIMAVVVHFYLGNNPDFTETAVIIKNYTLLVVPLIGFSLISTGARMLTSRSHIHLNRVTMISVSAMFVTLGLLYCYSSLRNFDVTSLSSSNNPLFLPIWLVVVTIVIPYLYTWFIGLLAAYELILLAQQSSGILYRQALKYVGYGVAVVIISSITLQYVNSVNSLADEVSLYTAFTAAYSIGIITALGYLLMALGATKLIRIERV